MKKAALLFMMGLIGLSVTAQADVIDGYENDFFVGASLGQSKLRVTSSELDGAGDTDETGFKFFGGWQLNPYFAFEAAYFNPGKFSESEDGDSITLDVDMLQFAAVGTFPIAGNLSGFGRIGVERWDATLTASSGFNTGTLTDTGTELLWGAGIVADMAPHLQARVEFEQRKIDQSIGDLPLTWRLRFFSLGLSYRF